MKTKTPVEEQVDEMYYNLIQEIRKACHTLTFAQADELLEVVDKCEDPFMVKCTNDTWKKTDISQLTDEVGMATMAERYTVRFRGGPNGHTLFETRLPYFIADRVIKAVKEWDAISDDTMQKLAEFEVANRSNKDAS